jgi:hypothetical protein
MVSEQAADVCAVTAPSQSRFAYDDRSRELVRQILQGHSSYLQVKLAKMSSHVKQELGSFVRASTPTSVSDHMKCSDEELATDLSAMSLDDLSKHVRSQLDALSTAQSGLEKSRSKGIHKLSAKTQRFMSEFDRFLSAYSGVMSVVTLVDAQHGGVACATLALLFAVAIPTENNVG